MSAQTAAKHAATRYGRRRLSPEAHAFRSKAATFSGLPDGVKSPHHLLATVKAAAPALGLSHADTALLDKLFQYTQAQDWSAPSRPIVWPSNATLAADLQKGIRTIKGHIHNLATRGLITMQDSPAGKRYGLRKGPTKAVDPGHSYGFDLSILALRYEELKKAAETHATQKAVTRALRRRAFIAKGKILQILDTADDAGIWSCTWDANNTDFQILAGRLTTAAALDDHRPIATRLEAMAGEMAALLAQALAERTVQNEVKTEEDSPTGAESCTLNNSTASSPIGFEIPVIASKGRSQPHPSDNGAGEAPRPTRSETEKRSADDSDAYEPEARTSPREIAALAPQLEALCPSPVPTWAELDAAADALRARYEIGAKLWEMARGALGERLRIVAFANVLTYPASHFTAGPGAYFAAMIRRAERGELDLARAIYGMRKRAEARSSTEALAEAAQRSANPAAGRTLADIARKIAERLGHHGADTR